MIGASRAVLGNRTPEFGHGHQDNAVLIGAEIGPEGVDGFGEIPGSSCESSLMFSLSAMGIPAVGLGEGDLEPHSALDKEGDLAQ